MEEMTVAKRGNLLFDVKLFFNSKAVIDATERTERRVLSRFGAFVRRRARSSIRKARQKKLAELTKPELLRYRRAQKRFRAGKGSKPRRPLKASEPGKPPRYRSGLIRRIQFVYDRRRNSVDIGPVALRKGGLVPDVLEYGGVSGEGNRRFRIGPRPYMRPALKKEWPSFDRLWAQARK